ncbi:hypothetical protein [Paenisporosarcina sp. OV554]|uniref:hypothetical protein n=1 Tax=Paenisporosarcina sp. OV554 TaxID=2135694 RepID=UPI0013050651|nr:hypothetical protein [Paenisporosarcina sp. OV554]
MKQNSSIIEHDKTGVQMYQFGTITYNKTLTIILCSLTYNVISYVVFKSKYYIKGIKE